jgi:hypothetical protein
MFVADGNFKADHVRQKYLNGDVWLSEGGGMIPKRDEYLAFLRSAIERLTVSSHYISGYYHTNVRGISALAYTRKRPVKIDFKRL